MEFSLRQNFEYPKVNSSYKKWNFVLDELLYNYFVALSNIRNGVKNDR